MLIFRLIPFVFGSDLRCDNENHRGKETDFFAKQECIPVSGGGVEGGRRFAQAGCLPRAMSICGGVICPGGQGSAQRSGGLPGGGGVCLTPLSLCE